MEVADSEYPNFGNTHGYYKFQMDRISEIIKTREAVDTSILYLLLYYFFYFIYFYIILLLVPILYYLHLES